MIVLSEGLHEGIPHDIYHADPSEKPSLSSHVANVLLEKNSAAHAKLVHPRFGGQRVENSDAMDTGSLLHAFLLGGGADIVEVDAEDWRTKDARDKRDQAYAAGMIPVLAYKLADIKAAAPLVRSALAKLPTNPIDLDKARTEVTALWASNGCPCRCRIDALMPDLWIWDLKFSDDAALSAQDRNIASSGYHVQAAANIDAVESTVEGSAGRVRFGLCFIEWRNPEIGIIRKEIRGQLLEVGQRRWNRAKGVWAQSLKEGRFAGYSTDIVEAECPPWIAADDMTDQLNNKGQEPF